MMSVLIFFNEKYLIKMISRYNDISALPKEQLAMMRKGMIPLFIILVIHTILIFISAFYMSREVWGFIAGPLFYIIVGVYFLFNFLKMKQRGRRMG
jgi:CHASE3 domain sensor protein